MSDVDLRALIRVRERLAGFRGRSWSDRLQIFGKTGSALLILPILALLRGLLVLIYTPIAIIARLMGVRFLYDHALSVNFGHLALDPGVYLKAQAIGYFPDRRAVLMVSRNKLPNRFLLDQWRSRFRVISHPVLTTLLTPLKWSRLTGTPAYLFKYRIITGQGELLEYGPAVDEIEQRYEISSPGETLLTLDDDVDERGRRVLQGLGIPRDAWWVALHVREGNYHGTSGSPRNADPLSYLDAVRAIIKRGGYVVRIGDPGMMPLPPMDGLVDYAHSSVKSDWMDVFTIGRARFLLETDSGPGAVAWLFDVPVAGTNWVPICEGLLKRHDIRIPKLIMRGTPPVAISFDHLLNSEKLRDLHTAAGFNEAGMTWKDNTPDEIRALTVEMMDCLDGVAEYETRDKDLQQRFHELVIALKTPQTLGTMSKVGRDFLRDHADLLQDEGIRTPVQ